MWWIAGAVALFLVLVLAIDRRRSASRKRSTASSAVAPFSPESAAAQDTRRIPDSGGWGGQ